MTIPRVTPCQPVSHSERPATVRGFVAIAQISARPTDSHDALTDRMVVGMFILGGSVRARIDVDRDAQHECPLEWRHIDRYPLARYPGVVSV